MRRRSANVTVTAKQFECYNVVSIVALRGVVGRRLNTVREICARCPLAMTEELLGDLALYKKYKDKSVMMASRSLIQLFRTLNPQLLHRRHRVSVCGTSPRRPRSSERRIPTAAGAKSNNNNNVIYRHSMQTRAVQSIL